MSYPKTRERMRRLLSWGDRDYEDLTLDAREALACDWLLDTETSIGDVLERSDDRQMYEWALVHVIEERVRVERDSACGARLRRRAVEYTDQPLRALWAAERARAVEQKGAA